jgi:site-specific recombinase XerD
MKELAEGVNVKTPLYRTVKYLEQYRDGGNIQLSQVTSEWVQSFQNYLLKETGLSQMTASHYSTSLRHVLNMAVKNRIITSNPADTVKNIPIPETNKPTLTSEELKRLANTPINGKLGKEVKRGFLFACNTGLRISDITTLTWADIEQRPVNNRNQFPNWIHKLQKKTKHYVSIPLNNTAWTLIQPRGFPSTYVFPVLAVSGTHTDKYIKNWAKKAGIEKVISWHTARRTVATLELENGVDPFTVERMLGHTKIQTTAIYAHSTDSMKGKAVNALPDILDVAEQKKTAEGNKS